MPRDLFSRIQGFGRRFNAIVAEPVATKPVLIDEDDYHASIKPTRRARGRDPETPFGGQEEDERGEEESSLDPGSLFGRR